MTVDRVKFLDLLKKVFPFTDSKGSFNQGYGYDSFLFANGYLSVLNNYSSMSVKLPEDFDIDYMIINAKMLKSVFEKMKGNEIILTFQNDVLHVKDGTMNVKIQGISLYDEVTYSIDKVVEELHFSVKNVEWKNIPENFLHGLNFCAFLNNSSFAGIYVKGKDMYDSNFTSILSWFKLNEEMDEFFLPDDIVKVLCRMKELKKYYVDETWIHFITEKNDVFFSVRLIVDMTFKKNGADKIRDIHLVRGDVFNGFLPDGFLDVLDRAALFIEKYVGALLVDIDFTKNGITVNAKKDGYEFMEFVEWQGILGEFEDFSICVDIEKFNFGLREKLLFSVFKDRKGKECPSELSFSNLIDKLYVFIVVLKNRCN